MNKSNGRTITSENTSKLGTVTTKTKGTRMGTNRKHNNTVSVRKPCESTCNPSLKRMAQLTEYLGLGIARMAVSYQETEKPS